jgi:dihydroorotase
MKIPYPIPFLLLFITLLAAPMVEAQDFDLLIRNGHVIDPKNGVDGVTDVGIKDGRIAAVAADIPASRAARVVDATGLYVTPGLIDLHAHVFHGTEPDAYLANSYTAVPPDAFSFRSGVTTLVDVGGPGWRNIRQFIEQTVAHSDTRVLAFLNIVGSGMKGGAVEQNLADMDPKLTAMAARRHRDVVVGVKLAHYEGHEWEPTDRAVEAGERAGIPVMIDFGGAEPMLPIRELFFDHLRPGDIYTHAYAQLATREAIVDDAGGLRPFVREAQERGIIFDVGHGGGSFMYSAAVPATRAGLWPNTISTDLHTGSMNGGMKDVTNVMSKFLNLGMPLQQVIRATTWTPAEVIQRPALGNLDVGAEADVAVFRLREGDFGFVDVRGQRMAGRQKLETELTVRAGRVVWDLNGISFPESTWYTGE